MVVNLVVEGSISGLMEEEEGSLSWRAPQKHAVTPVEVGEERSFADCHQGCGVEREAQIGNVVHHVLVTVVGSGILCWWTSVRLMHQVARGNFV